MFYFKIINEDVKSFMNKLLKEEVFDKFEVRSVEINAFAKFSIDGFLDKSYFEEEISRNYCKWSEMKQYVYNIIKSCSKPKSIKITLSFPSSHVQTINSNAKALFLNLTFENNEILASTATAQKEFSIDKVVDIAWEDKIRDFLKKNSIVFLNV